MMYNYKIQWLFSDINKLIDALRVLEIGGMVMYLRVIEPPAGNTKFLNHYSLATCDTYKKMLAAIRKDAKPYAYNGVFELLIK